jgi:hypothetical protein
VPVGIKAWDGGWLVFLAGAEADDACSEEEHPQHHYTQVLPSFASQWSRKHDE